MVKKGDRLLFQKKGTKKRGQATFSGEESETLACQERTLTGAPMRYLSGSPFPDSVPASGLVASERIYKVVPG